MTARPAPVARAIAVLAAFVVSALTSPARAHEVGLSRGVYEISGDRVLAELTLSRREVLSIVPELDANGDGQFDDGELTASRALLEARVVRRIRVEARGAACAGALASAKLAEEDGLSLSAAYTCEAPVPEARIELSLLDDLAHGHRHIARSSSGAHVTEAVLSRSQRTLEIGAPPGAAPAAPKRDPLAMLALGVEHILTGYDHLVFLFGLVLIGGRWRALLWVVTAFTLAHSITLGLAALGVWSPRPSVVEPAIALSIAYVGVENFFVKNAEKRWRITFPFGLVHGFGFAGALQQVALPRAEVPAALFLFNAGVELGQLGVLAVVLPVLAVLRRRPWFEKHGVRVASAVIVIAGVVWFFARVFGNP